MKTIKDIEVQVEASITAALKELDLVPNGYRCAVRLRGKLKDKKRTASFEKNWTPDTDSIRIRFEPTPTVPEVRRRPAAADAAQSPPRDAEKSRRPEADPLSSLIRALDRAESRPGYAFVALKWFRDTVLPSEGFSWSGLDSERQALLRDAIDKRLILISKMPNPRSPQFPVTAIRLNRLMPEVRAILGQDCESLSDFQPVPLRGESLSETILRDRR